MIEITFQDLKGAHRTRTIDGEDPGGTATATFLSALKSGNYTNACVTDYRYVNENKKVIEGTTLKAGNRDLVNAKAECHFEMTDSFGDSDPIRFDLPCPKDGMIEEPSGPAGKLRVKQASGEALALAVKTVLALDNLRFVRGVVRDRRRRQAV